MNALDGAQAAETGSWVSTVEGSELTDARKGMEFKLLGPEPFSLRREGSPTPRVVQRSVLGLRSLTFICLSTSQVPFSCGNFSWSCSTTGSAAAASAGRATVASSSCATPKR